MKIAAKKFNTSKKIVLRLLSLVLVTGILGSTNTFALDLLGSPTAELKQWQFGTGLEYSFGSMDFELTNGSRTRYLDGVPTGVSGYVPDIALDDFESDKINTFFGYGIAKDWEVFVCLGMTSSEFGDSLSNQSEKFDSEYLPSMGGGLKLTLVDEYNFKMGAMVKAGWSNYHGQLNSPSWLTPEHITVDIKEVQIAIGALYRWTDYISFYGGPFYHYITGELEDIYILLTTSGVYTSEYTWDIESSSDFGGYLGTQVELGKDFYLNLEYQLTGAADGIGAGIVWKF